MDPMTAIAIAQICIGLVQMMSSNGSGVADLLALQANMLRNISLQLTGIQKTLEVIFKDVEQLKALVRQLPSQQVVELFRAEVTGAASRYQEVMKTYDRDRAGKGIDYADANNRAEFEEIVNQIRRARDVLMGYRQEMTIPVVGIAMQTEIHCMILSGVRDNRIESAVETYRDWFRQWLDPESPNGLRALIEADAKHARELLDERKADAPNYDDLLCFNAHLVGDLYGGGMHARQLDATTERLKWTTEDDASLTDIYEPAATMAASGGYVAPIFYELRRDLPDIVKETIPHLDGTPADETYQYLLTTSARFVNIWPGFNQVCRDDGNTLKTALEAKKGENEPIVVSRLRLLSLTGFEISSMKCSQFCDDLLAKVSGR